MAFQQKAAPPVALTFFFHDYETTGVDKFRERPTQFAGIRTDQDLNIIEAPVMFFAKPADDVLVHPYAALLTRILPEQAQAEGLSEHAFAERVQAELGRPGTCGVGYNSLAYDDEITRMMNYRNFIPPYEREYANGNSRWDIIQLARLVHAIRPDGIQWPKTPEGRTSFRLEELVKANGLKQERAHDALSDVEATIELARLIKRTQPDLFEHFLKLRKKFEVSNLIKPDTHAPLIHVAPFYPVERAHLSIIAPLFTHPTQANSVYVLDLLSDPTPLETLDEAALLAHFTRKFEKKTPLDPTAKDALRGEDEEVRIGVTTIAINKSPPIAPVGALSPERAQDLNLDMVAVRTHLNWLRAHPEVVEKLKRVMTTLDQQRVQTMEDPELGLYAGGFPSKADTNTMATIRRLSETPERLAGSFAFDDPRYAPMLLRYRARNFPDTLTPDEQATWEGFVRDRLMGHSPLTTVTLEGYFKTLEELRAHPEHGQHTAFLDRLEAWGHAVQDRWFATPSVRAGHSPKL